MTKKKRVNPYERRTSNRRRPAPTSDAPERPNLATINLEAAGGRSGLRVGDRVRIDSSGIYSGESAVVERLTSGPIPAALVRTDSGGTRQVRTIDLVPLDDG
jgi:hypothetical protein